MNHVARWDGLSWSPLSGPSATGTSGAVEALAVFDDGTGPALYAGGSFHRAGGVVVANIARWDGVAWSGLFGLSAYGVNGTIHSLEGTETALYAGGAFISAGGVTVNRVARWARGFWSELSGPAGTRANGEVRALAAAADGFSILYAGGSLTSAGGVASTFVAFRSCVPEVFGDGFEQGDTSSWSLTVPWGYRAW